MTILNRLFNLGLRVDKVVSKLEELESRIKSLEDSRSKGVVESQSKSKLMAMCHSGEIEECIKCPKCGKWLHIFRYLKVKDVDDC